MTIRLANGKPLLRNGKLAVMTPGVIPSAATALALIDVSDGQIFQRIGTSKAIPVSFTFTGSPSAVQARVVSAANSNVEIVPWTVIATSPQGGAGLGFLSVPQGDLYQLQIRDSVNTALVSNGAAIFGVGMLLGNIGQSNMVNLGQAASGKYPCGGPHSRWYASADNKWFRVGNLSKTSSAANAPVDTAPPGTLFGATNYTAYTAQSDSLGHSQLGDGVVNLVNTLTAALGIPVGILPYAVIGSPITPDWQPGISGNNYDNFVKAIDACGGDIEGALWLQGEDGPLPNYQQNLQNICSGLQAHTGRGVNFMFAPIILGPSTTYEAEGWFGTVRQAVLSFVSANASTPGVFLGGSALDANLAGDGVHFNGASQAQQGFRDAKAIIAHVTGIGAGSRGPKIISATHTGLRVDFTVQHAGGTTMKDGAGGNGSSLLGFRFYDNNVQMFGPSSSDIVASTSITAADTISVTLKSAPVGTLTADFGMANAPFTNNLVPATVPYDDDTVPGDTLGLPLQPCAAITVTGA